MSWQALVQSDVARLLRGVAAANFIRATAQPLLHIASFAIPSEGRELHLGFTTVLSVLPRRERRRFNGALDALELRVPERNLESYIQIRVLVRENSVRIFQ